MNIIQANKFYYLKGGAERYVFLLSSWLEAQGHSVIPFAMEHENNMPTSYASYFPRYVQTEKVEVSLSGLRTIAHMMYSPEARNQMASLLSVTSPEIAHIHNIYTQLSPSILYALHDQGVPTIMTVHDHHLVSPQYNIWAKDVGEDHRHAGLIRGSFSAFHKNSVLATFGQILSYRVSQWQDAYRRFVDQFIVPSEYMMRQMIEAGYPKEKITLIHHGIDPNSVEPNYENEGYFLYVGRLSEEKGVETIVEIAKALPDRQFKIVGTGPEEEYLHRLSHELMNIEFLGFKSGGDLIDLYKGAIAVLLPSRVEEVFPMTILEAMAAGKPVIASEVGGVPEIVVDRMNGFLVRPLDMNGWKEAVDRLASSNDLSRQLGMNAREAIEGPFHIERHFERVMQVYQIVMKNKVY